VAGEWSSAGFRSVAKLSWLYWNDWASDVGACDLDQCDSLHMGRLSRFDAIGWILAPSERPLRLEDRWYWIVGVSAMKGLTFAGGFVFPAVISVPVSCHRRFVVG
jgi:hypothetical protein